MLLICHIGDQANLTGNNVVVTENCVDLIWDHINLIDMESG